MSKSNSYNCFRACILTASLAFAPVVFADVVELSPALPPANGVYTLTDTCISVICLEHTTLSNFTDIHSSISGGNEVTMSNVDLTASLFQNVSGMPGAFIGGVTLSGSVDITYFGRTELSEPGTFTGQITALDLTGAFVTMAGPQTIEAKLNPAEPSTGQTTETPIGGVPAEFRINSFFDVFTELSIDNGPFVPGPEREADLTATPEPAYLGSVGILLAGIIAFRVVKSKRLSKA